jgi:hypothetical protein
MTAVSPTSDLAPAQWLVEALPHFGGRVADLLPSGYEALVRVFHRPDQGRPEAGTSSSWAEVAAQHGTVLHPEAQWEALTHGSADNSSGQPDVGSLDPLTLPRLADHLGRHTATPDRCHVALWNGTGRSPRSWETHATFRLPGRAHWLFPPVPVADVVRIAVAFELKGYEEELAETGRLSGLMTFGPGRPSSPSEVRAVSTRFLQRMREAGDVRSPSWWWPDDRAWVVHSEVDHDSTLVAGSSALLRALLDDAEIECLEVTPTTSLLANADHINTPNS